MQTHPPSPQPGNGSHSRLCCSSLRPSAYHAVPSGGVQLEGGDALSHSSHPRDWQPELSPPEIDHSPTTDLSTLINLAGRLQPFLLPGYRWLGQEDLKIVGTRPIDAGGFADVWVGEMGDRKIAVKSYRCYASANCTSIYNRFCHEALVYTRFSGHRMVPFIGVYSAREHPFALVFWFMEHLNLRDYLKNHRDIWKLELLFEVACVLKDMHSTDAVHGNLKITNILVDADGRVRVAGLGAASIPSTMPGVDIDRFFQGAAPELVDPQRFGFVCAEHTKASDVYAFGIIAWEVFAGRVPFYNKSKVAGIYSMMKGHRPSRPSHPELSDHVWKIIKGCWKSDPTQRKTVAEVVTALRVEVHAQKSQ